MQSMAFEDVLRAITTGNIASIAERRTNEERRAIASFISGKVPEKLAGSSPAGPCDVLDTRHAI
jgi:polyvinyl alcohol dehydrogenase (cytochrome)